jgi:hypothetical protein
MDHMQCGYPSLPVMRLAMMTTGVLSFLAHYDKLKTGILDQPLPHGGFNWMGENRRNQRTNAYAITNLTSPLALAASVPPCTP